MKRYIAIICFMSAISSAFAATYNCTFDVKNSEGKYHADYAFDSNTNGGLGMDVGGMHFQVYNDVVKERDTIALSITRNGERIGTLAPMGTTWVYLIDSSNGAQIYCKL